MRMLFSYNQTDHYNVLNTYQYNDKHYEIGDNEPKINNNDENQIINLEFEYNFKVE